ncbi:GPP34 family phosphoprotein [Amycolatopsis sp. PS_44_ISF1]|uniref:GPP34 family phosphoprotein n=1 Tax=Amycolatopsis sp. PS_44_ISF1 TaxID=2974917 RepID=UPI0028DE9A35|nr:GPP34 family phosphoprotein [Amycolatopsis sp. PS_44_ISF1]MDT8913552.1 GPP34 family phosphoprotein [Amycolatopsis sp. PS_44_ISF1]
MTAPHADTPGPRRGGWLTGEWTLGAAHPDRDTVVLPAVAPPPPPRPFAPSPDRFSPHPDRSPAHPGRAAAGRAGRGSRSVPAPVPPARPQTALSWTAGTAGKRVVPRYRIEGYRGSDRLADQVLGALYLSDMYRSDVRDPARVSAVLGAMLLAELSLAGHLILSPDGMLHPIGGGAPGDTATAGVLAVIAAEARPRPVVEWLTYLALDERASQLVWLRLVARGEARVTHRHGRAPGFTLATAAPVGWARHLLAQAAARTTIPASAATLWHALALLQLDGKVLQLDTAVCTRLQATAPPGPVRLLMAVLDQWLTHHSTCH